MKYTVTTKIEKDTRTLSEAFKNTLDEVMAADKDVVYLDADLMSCLGTQALAPNYDGRIINCGIAEANMIGVAAGMSLVGKKPYIHSFGPFASRRSMDQIFMSLAYAKLGARIIGSDPGVTAAFNGGTHMPFEDMAILMSIPDSVVLEPSDYASVVELIKKTKDIDDKVVYIRLPRKNTDKIYEDDLDIEIGKAITVKEGSDATVITSGFLVGEAIIAAQKLATEGISLRVLDMFTWKPIDREAIVKCATETGAIVTAENHNTLCGLGAAVANVVTETTLVPIEKVGVHDSFGQVGSEDFLREEYKLTADEIIAKVKKAIARKK